MERDEFSRRVRAMTDRLYRITYGQLHDPQDRMDAVQNALLKAWLSRHRLREPAYFETWLIRILINECHNIQRRRPFMPLDELPECPAKPDDSNTDVRDAILRLPEKQRMVIILHYMEGYKTAEIAKILRVPEETVRSRLKRARAALKILLAEP